MIGQSHRVVAAMAAVLALALVAACAGDDGEVVVSGADDPVPSSASVPSSATPLPSSSAPSTSIRVGTVSAAPTTGSPGSLNAEPTTEAASDDTGEPSEVAGPTGPYATVPHDDPPADPDAPTTTAPGASGVVPTPTGFTLTVGVRLDPCDGLPIYPQMQGLPCYEVLASWDDPSDPAALWNLVPGEDFAFHPELVSVPIGPWHYPSADGRVSVRIGVAEATTVCVRMAVYHSDPVSIGNFWGHSDLVRACVTTPGVPAAPTTTTSTTDPAATTAPVATTTTT